MNQFKEAIFQRGMTQEQNAERYKQNVAIGARFYKTAFLPTLIYAIIFGILIYDNYASITMPVFAVVTIIYCAYMIKKIEVPWKMGNVFYMITLFLLGIATFLTGNHYIQLLNYAAFLLMLVSMLVHQFYDDKKWGMGKYLGAVLFSIFGSVSCWGRPFSEGHAYRRAQRNLRANGEGKPSNLGHIIRGLFLSIPFVIILGYCLTTADKVFYSIMHSFGFDFNLVSFLGRVFFIFAAFVYAYAGIRFISLENYDDVVKEPKKANPISAMTFVTVLDILYLIFSLIQVTCLFMGGKLPEGVTYAEYARTGFFQLLFVCFANLVIVLFIKNFTENTAWLKILLLIFNACTFVMLASSAYRMMLYIQVYYLTFLRVFVLVALTLIGALLLGVTIYIFTDKFPMFKYGLICVTLIYLVFAFARVDYIIADYNLARVELTINEDNGRDPFKIPGNNNLEYYSGLSTDAAPAIKKHEEGLGASGRLLSIRYRQNHKEEFERDDFWHYNMSVHKAAELFEE